MTTTVKTSRPARHCAGFYTMTIGDRRLEVVRVDEWTGSDKWHWRDLDDRYCYGDPVATMRDAIRSATAYAQSRHDNPQSWR